MSRPLSLLFALVAALVAPLAARGADASCSVRSTRAPLVVELYTSEGCSSCPPADRWLSTLKGRSDVLALAFHVNYWDYLGWADRFASAEATERQRRLSRFDRSANVYTPQVRADGRDWTRWPDLPKPAAGAAPAVQLSRDGDAVVAQVEAAGGAATAAQWTGFWAVLEDGHESRVRAGENAGSTLRHDHVVRLYRPVAAWPAGQAYSSRLSVLPGVAERPRRIAFVLVDAATERPLQAAVLAC